ncbi:hypothetical protein RJ641_001159, partial [Dillenia turbinata]
MHTEIRIQIPGRQPLLLLIDLDCLVCLNLNSPSDLHKTFAFPWAEEPIKGDPEYTVPKMLLCASSLPLNVTYQRTKLNYEQPMN